MITPTRSLTARFSLVAVAVAVAALALTGCAATASDDDSASAAAATEASTVTISDAWVRAADSGMSAAFGELENDGDADATIVSASTEASPMIELHETTTNAAGEMVMRERDGGFVVPAGGAFTLEPGGNHIMLMDLAAALEPGAQVEFTLEFADGSTKEVTAEVREFDGADENYDGGDMDMDGMDGDAHADHEHAEDGSH